MDLDSLFREVTQRICGHLEIEKSLHACLELLVEHMPGRKMYLDVYDPEQGVAHTFAEASAKGGKRLNRVVPMSATLRGEMERFRGSGREASGVFVVNQVAKDPIATRMLEALGEPLESSLLGIHTDDGDRALGGIVLLADGTDRFTAEHVKLFAMLRLPFAIALSNALKHRELLELKERLVDDKRFLQREILRLTGEEIIGEEFGLAHAVRMARQVSAHDSPVLLLGETGVGKDILAQHIHATSLRRDGPMIQINCGAIPENLVDSELFGHEKGAFTGALSEHRGRFERAHGGTIFLDEVGELPLQAQVRLLRVLQHKEIERVGGSTSIKLDIRVIAATHRNLEEMVRDSTFREDLWYRLAVFPIFMPPLRERQGDIPALAAHFLRKKSIELKLRHTPRPTPEALQMLLAYNWPGNVRELQNVIERALILSPDDAELLSPETIILGTRASRGDPGDQSLGDHESRRAQGDWISPRDSVPQLSLALDDVVRSHIQRILAMTRGKVHGPDGAAAMLEINASTLRHRMTKLGIAYGRSEKQGAREK